MAKVFKLEETSIPELFRTKYETKDIKWDPNETPKMYDILADSITRFLSTSKKLNTPVGLMVTDLKGNMLMGAGVKYIEPEEGEEAGNWNYYWTFNKEDIDDLSVLYQITDTEFQRSVAITAHNMYKIEFTNAEMMLDILRECVILLIEFLDENAVEGERVSVQRDGIFIASVEVENGEKIMSITPEGLISKNIKNDAALERG